MVFPILPAILSNSRISKSIFDDALPILSRSKSKSSGSTGVVGVIVQTSGTTGAGATTGVRELGFGDGGAGETGGTGAGAGVTWAETALENASAAKIAMVDARDICMLSRLRDWLR